MRKIIIAVLLIIMAGCSSPPPPKKAFDNSVVPTTVIGYLPRPNGKKPVEETLPQNIPSYEQSRVYKEIEGFPDYIIGVGDVITITMLRAGGQESTDIKVPPSGKVSYSFIENIQVSGKTTTEITETIIQLLKDYVRNPRITVVVKEYNSKKVFFLGEINRIEGLLQSGPGVYPLTGKATLLKMLVSVGGHTSKADLSRVEITREGKVYFVNLHKIMTQAGPIQDLIIENEDRVFIPQFRVFAEEQAVKSRVYVLGEVKLPGLIESGPDLTILEALSRAQGLTTMANKGKARIVRGDINNPQVISVDLKRLIDKSELKLNLVLQDGDVLYIPTTFYGKFANFFTNITPILSALTYPAVYRDLYTTGGIGVLDTGARPTGGGAEGTTVTTETILSR